MWLAFYANDTSREGMMLPKVLIIEDDDIIREVYALKFELEGYPIRTAENGQQGLEIAADFEPEVILLDMMMPVMGGLDFMRAYEGTKANIVVFSNISAPQQMQEVMGLGAAEYWVKSDYTPDQVVQAVGSRWKR
jgi:CheY-like chemotaxis protein